MVIKKCCIAKCKSKSTRKEDVRVTYHKFPKDISVRDTWVKVTHLTHEVEVSKHVCSRHFLLTDFEHYQGRYVLKSGAVPSIFPWTKMDELDSLTTVEDTESDIRNQSTSSKDSEPENLEAIRNFIAEHDKGDPIKHKKIEDELKPDDVKMEVDDNSADSSIQSDKEETLAIASSVMDLIFDESADQLSKNNESTSHSSTIDKSTTSVSLSVGSKIEARDFSDTWHSAEIVEVDYDEMEVLVCYDSVTKKPEEWISVNSPRLRPVTGEIKSAEIDCQLSVSAAEEKDLKMKQCRVNISDRSLAVSEEEKVEVKPKAVFAIGERCLARWKDNRRFVATVEKDLGDGTYNIVFEDGFHWNCNANRLSKLKTDSSLDSRACSTPSPTPVAGPSTQNPLPVFHKHLFDPTRDYLGSKSERREQKRKLNIKEIFNIGQKQRRKETPVKEKQDKTPKEKNPKLQKKNVKVEPNIQIEQKDIPVAIASIIGMVNNDGKNKQSPVADDAKSNPKKKKSQTSNNRDKLLDDDTKFLKSDGKIKSVKIAVTDVSDEDTQSAKLSDTELDIFDDNNVSKSGDQDEKLSDDNDRKMSIDKIHEEDKVQNFERPDDVVHEQVIDRIKEAIIKLEDGLNKEVIANSPKVNKENNADSPIVKKDLTDNSPKVEKELIADSSKVSREFNADLSKLNLELDVDSPKLHTELKVNLSKVNTEGLVYSPEVNTKFNVVYPEETLEPNVDSLKANAENTHSVAKTEHNMNQCEIKMDSNVDTTKGSTKLEVELDKIETLNEDIEKPIGKVEFKQDPCAAKLKKCKKRSKNLLKLAHRIRVLGQEEKTGTMVQISSKLENIKKEMNEILMMFEKGVPDSAPSEGEWCCKWVNGEPVGTVIDTEPDNRIDVLNKIALPRKTVQVEDKRLPEGWTKLMVRRSLGNSAGKWDVVLVSPDKRRFHTKTDMRHYLESSQGAAVKSHEPALLDFAVHLKLARRMGWVTGDSAHASRGLVGAALPRKKKKLILKRGDKDRKMKKRKLSAEGRYKYDRESLPGTSGSSILDSPGNISFNNSTLEDGYVYVGSLKVQVIDNLLRCPADGCFKNFRNNTLLQMHIKHYHRELRKSLGATPKVLDLAYARTAPTETETRRHEPDSKIIKVKLPRLPRRIEEKLDMKEINIDPRGDSSSPLHVKLKCEPEKRRSMDSPMMRQFALQASDRPVKRPKVLLPVRRPEPQPVPEPEVPEPVVEVFESTPETRVRVPPMLPDLDFETAISTHTVSKPPEMRKVFATISKAPLSEDEDTTGAASDLETRSSCPGSGTPDSKTMEPRAVQNLPMSSESNEDSAMYMYTETGERIKLERMKREEIINCHCGFREEDGLMVQCELCLCWQHALCHNIQREADVPQKYTCSICLSPRRGRRSQRFLHDQDRMGEGLLPGGAPAPALRRSHRVSANLLHIADALHALRVKYYVATKKNHPKLYLWAKDWEGPETAFGQERPSAAYSELSVVVTGAGARGRSGSGSPGARSLLGGLLASPGGHSLDMPISTSELERLANSVQEQAEPRPVVTAPQPEAAIENGACRERLLRHVQRCQALIDARLDTLEAEIIELEAQDPSFEDDETADYFPRTKQTVQMLMRDLQSLEQLGLIT